MRLVTNTFYLKSRPTMLALVAALAVSRPLPASARLDHREGQRAVGEVLDRPARLDVHDVVLLKALQELADHARIALVYSPSLVPALTVSCPCAALTTREALETLLVKTTLTFREANGQV